MRIVFGLVLIAGLGLAGFAVYMAQNYIGAYENALQEERSRSVANIPTHDVYVSNRVLEYGEQIASEDVKLVPWPKQALPETYFDAENPIIGEDGQLRVAMRQIEVNEVFMDVKVSEPGDVAGLTSRLEAGQRAFAIKVDVASGVSGFLRPGDRVDVYWTGRIRAVGDNVPEGDVTRLIQSGVKLIAIDQTAQSNSSDATIARTVTVAASPQEVAALAQAQSTGRLSLSLLGRNDATISQVIEVDQRSLLGLDKRAAVEPPAIEQTCTIKTRKGGEVQEIPIPCTN